MTTFSLNKMASSRNLLCRPRQGGQHGSHGQKSTQESFVLSFRALESSLEATENLFSDLSGWTHLACEVSIDQGDCQRVWRRQYRWSPPIYQSLSQENQEASRRKSVPIGRNALFQTASFHSGRYALPKEGKENRRDWNPSWGGWVYQGFVCGDRNSESGNQTLGLGNSRLPAKKHLFQDYPFQKQDRDRTRNSERSDSEIPHAAHGLDGCLVCLRTDSQFDWGGRMDIPCCYQAKPNRGSERKENISYSPGKGSEAIQGHPGFQEKNVSGDEASCSSAQDRNRAPLYLQIEEGRNTVLCHEQPEDDRISNGQALSRARLDRDLPPRHETASRFWRDVYAFLGRRPNTLDSCHDRIQHHCLVERNKIQKLSSDDSSFQRLIFSRYDSGFIKTFEN